MNGLILKSKTNFQTIMDILDNNVFYYEYSKEFNEFEFPEEEEHFHNLEIALEKLFINYSINVSFSTY